MKNKSKKALFGGVCLLALFAAWTAAVRLVDVQAIGPEGSSVGFASLNGFFHSLTGVHLSWYILTDWLSLIPFAVVGGFGLLGLVQWLQRKKLWKVDGSILALGVFYLLVMAFYLFFEVFVINYRPVLIDGVLEASYPSSTTMLMLCVMPTAMMQLHTRIQKPIFRQSAIAVMTVFTVFMVAVRLLSGVHWLTDIIGGVLLSAGLVLLYSFFSQLMAK